MSLVVEKDGVRIIHLNNVRLSFPELFTPKAFQEGQDKKYQASFLIDPETPEGKKTIKVLKAEIERTATDKWKGKAPKNVQFLGEKCCAKDGDQKEYDGYAGMVAVASSNKRPPLVVDRDKTILKEEDGKPYAGCFVNATITLWAQDNQFGKRVNANLRGVQFFADGEAFGAAGPDVEDEFDAVGGEDADGEDFC